ncbi:hypothetical protein VTO42DRAFT_3107 [Malbranchea cinnamomea]
MSLGFAFAYDPSGCDHLIDALYEVASSLLTTIGERVKRARGLRRPGFVIDAADIDDGNLSMTLMLSGASLPVHLLHRNLALCSYAGKTGTHCDGAELERNINNRTFEVNNAPDICQDFLNMSNEKVQLHKVVQVTRELFFLNWTSPDLRMSLSVAAWAKGCPESCSGLRCRRSEVSARAKTASLSPIQLTGASRQRDPRTL